MVWGRVPALLLMPQPACIPLQLAYLMDSWASWLWLPQGRDQVWGRPELLGSGKLRVLGAELSSRRGGSTECPGGAETPCNSHGTCLDGIDRNGACVCQVRARWGWGGGPWRGCTDLVHPSARKTSAAQPARSVETPTGSVLPASQVSAGQAGGRGRCPLGGQWGPSLQPAPTRLRPSRSASHIPSRDMSFALSHL